MNKSVVTCRAGYNIIVAGGEKMKFSEKLKKLRLTITLRRKNWQTRYLFLGQPFQNGKRIWAIQVWKA